MTPPEMERFISDRAMRLAIVAHHEGTHRATMPGEVQDAVRGLEPGSDAARRAYARQRVMNEAFAYGNEIDLADSLGESTFAAPHLLDDGTDVTAAYRAERQAANAEYERLRPPPTDGDPAAVARYRSRQEMYSRQIAIEAIAPLVARLRADEGGPTYEVVGHEFYRDLHQRDRSLTTPPDPVARHRLR